MMATAILLLAVAAPAPPLPPGEEPAALVERLRSPDPQARADASEALKAIGGEALPALAAAARDADDPADRDRALALWREVARDAMTRPTLIPPDLLGRSKEEVTNFVGRLSEASQGGGDRLRDTPGRDAGAIPLWEAIERLCDANAWTPYLDGSRGPYPPLRFHDNPIRPHVATPGPFRVTVGRLVHRRDRRLIEGPWIDVDRFAQRLDVPGDPGSGPIDERFDVELKIMVEPRTRFVQAAPARAIEAVDDLGQSLAIPEGREVPYRTFSQHGGTFEHHTTLPLAYPARPGSRIVRLTGVVPVLLEAREPLPALVVPLADAEGRVESHGGVTIEVARASVGEAVSVVTLDVRVDLDPADLHGFDASVVTSAWLGDLMKHQFELVNADGAVLSGGGTGGYGPDGRGRITVSTRSAAGPGPATELRYYPMLREPAEIAFEFTDLPMP